MSQPSEDVTQPIRIYASRVITRPLTEEQIRVRDLHLAEHRRLAENERGHARDCKG